MCVKNIAEITIYFYYIYLKDLDIVKQCVDRFYNLAKENCLIKDSQRYKFLTPDSEFEL